MANSPVGNKLGSYSGKSTIKTGTSRAAPAAGRGGGGSPLPGASQRVAAGNATVYARQGRANPALSLGRPARQPGGSARLPGHRAVGGQKATGATRSGGGATSGSQGY
jgi:hypothetical protein